MYGRGKKNMSHFVMTHVSILQNWLINVCGALLTSAAQLILTGINSAQMYCL